MKFNPDLIQKARKGEIAILNDGSVEELQKVLKEVWPQDDWMVGGASKFYSSHFFDDIYYTGTKETKKPTHSVKSFFMPDTKEPEIVWNSESFVKDDRPRTYRVTRQQMKEIWSLEGKPRHKTQIENIVNNHFGPFKDEAILDDVVISIIKDGFESVPDTLKSIFPEYFFIPKGEPVLRRELEDMPWKIGVSDGKGGVYSMSGISGPSDPWKFIIPFTKNPPK